MFESAESVLTYEQESPAEFFEKCYDLRSEIVHGRETLTDDSER